MFISRKEKAQLLADIDYLRTIVQDLSKRVFQLEGWIPVGKGELPKNSNAYKWVKEHPTPKKRGRPVGSKNKEK